MPACILLVIASAVVFVGNSAAWRNDDEPDANIDVTLYDRNPKHLWNRLHSALFVRTAKDGRVFGRDELDPLLWDATKYLRSGPSYQKAINLLDEFLSTNGERLITDPIKRAILQRDLWAVFDWYARVGDAKKEIIPRLARVIQRLELSPGQIHALPDSYQTAVESKSFPVKDNPGRPDDPFLPPDLFQANGPWVELGADDGDKPTAQIHSDSFSRSVFLVFIRLPDGRQATIDYLKKLNAYTKPMINDPHFPGRFQLNPAVPRFPVGTRTALVRRMMLIDNRGQPVATHVVESIQLRVFRELLDGYETRNHATDKFEFRLRRARLFGGESGSLEPIKEEVFIQFLSHGDDVFEESYVSPDGSSVYDPFKPIPIRQNCVTCHENMTGISGIGTVISYRHFAGSVSRMVETTADREAEVAVRHKQAQPDWKDFRENVIP